MIARELSGVIWCARYPGDDTTATLKTPFRWRVQSFIESLEAPLKGRRARISIESTRRPFERVWLQRMAWDIAHGLTRPELVPPRPGIPIAWVHPSHEQSLEAARAMVAAYGLVHRPSLSSRHLEGLAVDMEIDGWEDLEVKNGRGERVRLHTREDLYQLGASFGVYKLRSDPPHWSLDGR